MPAKSKSQRKFFAMCEHGKATKSECPNMSKAKMHEYAATKEKGLPQRKRKRKSEWQKLG